MKKESEISPYVQDFFTSKGYCIHGEVNGLGLDGCTIDHYAHLGPCESPDYGVSIELKLGATKDLREQCHKRIDLNLAHEVWGVVFEEPTIDAKGKWIDGDSAAICERFSQGKINAGLMYLEPESEEIFEVFSPTKRKRKPYRMSSILLVEENKNKLGGVSSKNQDGYVSHWSIMEDRVTEYLSEKNNFTTKELFENVFVNTDLSMERVIQDYLRVKYDSRKHAMYTVLKVLRDEKEIINQKGKDGRHTIYERKGI